MTLRADNCTSKQSPEESSRRRYHFTTDDVLKGLFVRYKFGFPFHTYQSEHANVWYTYRPLISQRSVTERRHRVVSYPLPFFITAHHWFSRLVPRRYNVPNALKGLLPWLDGSLKPLSGFAKEHVSSVMIRLCAWTRKAPNIEKWIEPWHVITERYMERFISFSWWRHQMETFSALLALCAGNSPAPVTSPQKGQWRGALMFSLICAWINGWVNNREVGDLRRYRAHYDVTVMF